MKSVSYGAGSRVLKYDRMGNTTEEVDNINVSFDGAPFSKITQFSWDNLGRMLWMKYPDGEELSYRYDTGGLVAGVFVVKSEVVPYVKTIAYDRFGQRVYMQNGNDIATNYYYDSNTRRLTRLFTYEKVELGAGGTQLLTVQDLNYDFDFNGNITGVQNTMYRNIDGRQETVERSFGYDGFLRLSNSTGYVHDINLPAGNDIIRRYDTTTQYDDIHNITQKTQLVSAVVPETNTDYNTTSYNNAYSYVANMPHVLESCGTRNFLHDSNGNNKGTSSYCSSNELKWLKKTD